MKTDRQSEKGSALLIAMLFLLILSILMTALHQTTITDMLFSRNYQESQKAFYAAETGIRAGMQWLVNSGKPPEDSLTADPWFSPTKLTPPGSPPKYDDSMPWSPDFDDSISKCSYRFFVEHLMNAPISDTGKESAKIGTSSATGMMLHYYRITAEGISNDQTVRRQVQLVTTIVY